MKDLSTCQQKRKKVAKKEKSYDDDDCKSDLSLTLSTSCPTNRVHHTTENESRLQFFDTEIWAPDWNEFIKSGVPPDIFVKLYNLTNSQTTRQGLIIAIPRRLSLQQSELIETELSRLTKLIPNSTLTMTTRLWQPWFKFDNNIEDMNPHELEKIIKRSA